MRILVAGDFCPTYRIQTAIDKQDYSAFDNITQVTGNVDYSIVNLECPIVIDGGKPIDKCGPNLRTTPNVINALQYTKFDCVTLANNHFRDFGDDGCNTTLKLLKDANIDYVGGGENITSAQQILYKQFGNKIIGIVNFCEN
ncbi:MAG: CapA family protein, partial [Alistipes sp.]|nr:CapA family protein [Alistipes sp.]